MIDAGTMKHAHRAVIDVYISQLQGKKGQH